MNQTKTSLDNFEQREQNSIIFICDSAVDFTEEVYIELSLEYKEGFTSVIPFELLKNILKIKNIQHIIYLYFYKICRKMPHFNDTNEIFYKCYRKFSHTHRYGEYVYRNLEIDNCINYIIKENLSIVPPTLTIDIIRQIKIDTLI
jgi:hypothetical protein